MNSLEALEASTNSILPSVQAMSHDIKHRHKGILAGAADLILKHIMEKRKTYCSS